MARRGVGYFDSRGQYFKHPDEAVVSDLASLLGRVGEGEGLAPGIARMMLDKREDIEQLYREYDEMMLVHARDEDESEARRGSVSIIRAA
ncbi:MAG: hypothetical protein RL367_1411 [Pseudomonadota bacterium]|jgi:hypothetical protein